MEKQTPVINNALDIAQHSFVPWNVFLSIVNNPLKHYHYFKISKKRGGYRLISSPDLNLEKIQKFIYLQILKHIPIHDCAVGFRENMSIKNNALIHQKSEKVLNIDLKDFYPSINRNRIYYVFMNLCNYNKLVSDDLVKLCSLENGIPQGAATSPALSNIITFKLDCLLSRYANERGIKYTRYADDLTFSGPSKSINTELYRNIKAIIDKQGFKVNCSKTRFGMVKNGVIITGLRVYNDKIAISREYIKKITMELYFIEKFGLYNHLMHEGKNYRNYLSHLKGKIGFINYIEPTIGSKLKIRYLNLIKTIESDQKTSIEKSVFTLYQENLLNKIDK